MCEEFASGSERGVEPVLLPEDDLDDGSSHQQTHPTHQ